MAADELFGELPEQAKPQADAAPLGAPRLREPERDQFHLSVIMTKICAGRVVSVRVFPYLSPTEELLI
jgi:hypothetical protein